MWIIIHQNALELSLPTMATGTSLVPVISVPPGFLSLLGCSILHHIYVYNYCSSYPFEKT